MGKYEISFIGEDDWGTCDGFDAEDAASEFAKVYNESGDYPLMNETRLALVRDVESGAEVVVSISAEPDIYYSSSTLDSVKCHHCKQELIEQLKAGKEMYQDDFCSRNCYCLHYGIATTPQE